MSVDPTKYNAESITFILFFIASSVSPGCLYFYVFHGELVLSLDWIKLLVLSLAVTLPFYILNSLGYTLLNAVKANVEEGELTVYFKQSYILASMVTMQIFYLSFVMVYFKEIRVAKEFWEYICVMEIAGLLIIIGMITLAYFKNKRKTGSSR